MVGKWHGIWYFEVSIFCAVGKRRGYGNTGWHNAVLDFYATDLVFVLRTPDLKKKKARALSPTYAFVLYTFCDPPPPPPGRAPRPLSLSLRPVWYALLPTRSTNCPKSFDRRYSSLSPSFTGRSQSNRRPPRSAPCQCPLCTGFGAPAACR